MSATFFIHAFHYIYPPYRLGGDGFWSKGSTFSSRRLRSLSSAAMSVHRNDPENAEALASFDKSKFMVQLPLRALRIPKEQSSRVSKILSGYTLNLPRLKHIVHDPVDDNMRLVILAENVSQSELPEDIVEAVKVVGPFEEVVHLVDLNYTYWSVEHILKEILPKGWKLPSSFETIGHIAHLNLTDELLPYRKVIADVFLDKNPSIRTVVNKVGTISNEFRVPTLEFLAGEENLVTEVKQYGARFQLDYGLVYWNSRLEFEHKRLVSQFQPGQIVCDMFAGIGPFSIPAAQKGCIVYANDLNPDSVKYLNINAIINKVVSRISTYNMDAREFMHNITGCGSSSTKWRSAAELESINDEKSCSHKVLESEEDLRPSTEDISRTGSEEIVKTNEMEEAKLSGEVIVDQTTSQCQDGSSLKTSFAASDVHMQVKSQNFKSLWKMKVSEKDGHMRPEIKPWETFHHVIMNLPASALQFLDVFQGLLSKSHWKGPLPRIHCYCFMRANETTGDVLKRAESILQGRIENPQVWIVRDVAPNKIMLCLSFDLPKSVAFMGSTSCSTHLTHEGLETKRMRT